MKAIVYTKYGSPDVIELREIEKKAPDAGEVLVKVYAAGTNPLDWHIMRADPFLVRLDEGFFKPKNTRMGVDFAGVVEAVGSGVTQFKAGDAVYGCVKGAFAEYVTIRETRLAHKPVNMSFEEAAAVPVAAFTALGGLRDVKPGQKVLVNGASGGVGTFAVQIAKAYGAEVTGVCSTHNMDMVRSIGADHVIDYTREDFTNNGQHYDLIYDAIGNRSTFEYRRALKPEGKCIVAGITTLVGLFSHMIIGALVSKFGSRKVSVLSSPNPNQKDLLEMKTLIEAGKVKSVIDRCYPLSETADAIRYLETKRARGKVIIGIATS